MALAQSVSAHYTFQQLSVGSTKYPVFQYIRQNLNYNYPVTDLDCHDLRCKPLQAKNDGVIIGVKRCFSKIDRHIL
ncbi:uncharacterized protein FRV6_15413 [Fusarium oxysporum]|uniref:Uncharacterized protein n=1 Tax=Fusarium oxysporum TaxID=5507 RepID=A0A2H3TUD9_FUSOX|nr:uncharacterized protein FRV6_15413 [Fusarium oxysporum]